MDELCSACLCAGRKLYSLSETTFENLYSQIINEIPLFSTMDLHILICWECKALLRRFKQFKEQAKKCYTELLAYEQQNTVKPFGTYPRLQICQLPSESFPQIIKEELEDQSPLDEPMDHEPLGLETLGNEPLGLEPLDHEPLGDDYEVKSEKHFEPETFVNDFNVEKIKKKKVKKVVKPIKQKPKAKSKIKKEKKSSIKQQHVSKTVEALIDSTVDDCYNKKEVEEENGEVEEEHRKELEDKMDDVDIEIKIVRALNIKVKNKSKSEANKPLTDKPTCGECGKTFSSKKTYRYHLNVLHKGQNKYPCPRCGKVYQWKSNLGRHMRSHKARDSDELYCELCDKRFASVATYRQHLKISRRHVSEEEFSFMCNECGKKFVNKTRLRDHIDWEHLKKIKFKCQLCNKPFKCHTSLYVHMQNVHRSKDKKDNLCHVCGKSYQNAAKLKYHIIAMHTSETPYQCQQCNAAFGWYSSLYRHVREVHYKMKVQPKKNKKLKKSEMLPSLLPVIPQQICLPQLHQPGPA